MSVGVMYVAFGRPYLAMALVSIRSLRQTNPKMPIQVVTNVAPSPPDGLQEWRPGDDIWSFLDWGSEKNRQVKTQLNKFTAFDRTIFLDCDTIVMGPMAAATTLLDYWDVGLRLNPYPQTADGKGDVDILKGQRVSALPHWNSGVVMFRNNAKTDVMFDLWHRLYKHYKIGFDQVALVEALFRSEVRLLSLGRRWNASDPFFNRGPWREETIIFHYGSNISNRLRQKILEHDRLLSPRLQSGQDVTLNFIASHRRRKLHLLGWRRYLILRALWQFSSPVK